MAKQTKGVSLDYLPDYYDILIGEGAGAATTGPADVRGATTRETG
jgi:hypothetical protein